MDKIRKIRRTAVIVFVLLGIFFIMQTVQRTNLFMLRGSFSHASTPLLIVLLSLAQHIGLFVLCFLLLRTIIKNETPFKKKVVGLLKVIALLFILVDVQGVINIIYHNHLRNNPPPILHTTHFTYSDAGQAVGYAVAIDTTTIWIGGLPLIAGLVIYLIALVLKHGISLQAQVDETL